MTIRVSGPFDVKLTPQPASADDEATIGRLTLDKQYHGALEATSRGYMLAARGAVPNSAGYVAIERVSGTLEGKRGSFVLQHSSTMTRGVPAQGISVVPDSGTDELTGLSGTMTVVITDGKHAYDFAYVISA